VHCRNAESAGGSKFSVETGIKSTGHLEAYLLLLAVNSNEMGYGAIVGALGLWREETAWQLSHAPVVADALAALAFSGTGIIGAGALC
jgi:hypothetical protein